MSAQLVHRIFPLVQPELEFLRHKVGVCAAEDFTIPMRFAGPGVFGDVKGRGQQYLVLGFGATEAQARAMADQTVRRLRR